jgi:asparagine synthase (glutamine-hydrolysing)
MCGICGIYSFRGETDNRTVIRKMCDSFKYRGPDDEGYYRDGMMTMGMRRLSIIDLEGGHQPIMNETGQYHIIMNGEIYNYRELRKELLKKGHKFSTDSDTEVALHMYEEYGVNFLSYINGMFAIAIWDNASKNLFIARDRLGIKPLYYKNTADAFCFSSTLKALMIATSDKRINHDAFLTYISFGYLPSPVCILDGVKKLEPGCYMQIRDGSVRLKKYWDVHDFGTQEIQRPEVYTEQLMELLNSSIVLRKRSDVPLGTFLSGGVDSSCITALLAKHTDIPIKTLSVHFEGKPNSELPYARQLAKMYQTNHSDVVLGLEEIPALLKEAVEYMDEPISDSAILPTLKISTMAAESGLKVMLSGSGGDEIFGGYHRYMPQSLHWKILYNLPRVTTKILGSLVAKFDFDKGIRITNDNLAFLATISGVNLELMSNVLSNNADFSKMCFNAAESFERILGGKLNLGANKNQLMYLDLKHYLEGNVLSLMDKMTMAKSIEGRVPLLDHRIVEFAFSLPEKVKIKNGQLKYFFKQSLRDILPDVILNRPKEGFCGPVNQWVPKILLNSMKTSLVHEPNSFYKETLKTNVVNRYLDECTSNWRYAESLYLLYIFDLWYRKHIEEEDIEI